MNGFTLKGIPLSTIMKTASTTAPGYTVNSTAIKYDTTTFANSKPLSTGYQVSGVDLSNTAMAHNKSYTSTKSGTVPQGAKSCRYVLRGGGGGCGGGSGASLNHDGTFGDEYWVYGYHAYAGTQGATEEGKINISGTTYTVTIGSGGEGGPGGGYGYGDSPSQSISSKKGDTGSTGGSTYIKFTNKTPEALGGVGGAGGPKAVAPGPGGSEGLNVPGSRPGERTAPTVKGHTSWDNTNVENTGKGAWMEAGGTGGTGGNISGGVKAGSKGNSGSSGSAHIIWLYE